ncbi:beta-1,6-galactofuranosyltransferase [Flavobacteriaceae bacterium R38]|nr:beta-1,6-galactofuranosyltransferase [Flavobacteriaceae bacterium R38]
MKSNNLFYISRNYKFRNSAASKPKMDCELILSKNGFKNLGLKQSNYPSSVIGAIISFTSIVIGLIKLPRKSVFCMQYPLSKFYRLVTTVASWKKCTIIIIIHDVKFLMGKHNNAAKEIAKFKKAQYLIVHNESMNDWFLQNGYKGKMVNINVFDYLYPITDNATEQNQESKSVEVVFAGGLSREKSEFIYNVGNLKHKNYTLKLYGAGFESTEEKEGESNLSYQGVFSPEEIISKISGSYGLVWGGSTVDGCSGPFGKYLGYNNPHKTSLYLLCGLPIIVWKKAAISKFIEQEKIGITISSLEELDSVLDKITDSQYREFLKNVERVSSQIAEGHYLSKAIEKVLLDVN